MDELTADIQQYYGLDMDRLLLRGEFARLAALTAQLPNGSRTFRRLHPELEWDESTYMLALLCDQLANIAYGMGGGKGKRPKPLPRPKAKKKQRKKKRLDVDRARVNALLFGRRAQVSDAAGEEGANG